MMLTVLRHLLSILLLPFFVAVLVPRWLLRAFPTGYSYSGVSATVIWLSRSVGAVLILVGFLLFLWCVILFARVGRGTLASWDPTRKMVAIGPYQFVRNPMISGVVLVLIGQALFWGSWAVALWACIFVVINHMYFVLSEERGLEKRFGEDYRVYKSNVPRWLPRFTSYKRQ